MSGKVPSLGAKLVDLGLEVLARRERDPFGIEETLPGRRRSSVETTSAGSMASRTSRRSLADGLGLSFQPAVLVLVEQDL